MRHASIGLLAALVGIGGCVAATAPSGAPPSDADFGPPPTGVDQLIAAYLRDKLKDPQSAQIERVAGPSRITMKGSILGAPAYGWGVCFRANGKNAFGAYTGFRTYAVIWRDGRVVRSMGDMRDNQIDAGLAEAACRQIASG